MNLNFCVQILASLRSREKEELQHQHKQQQQQEHSVYQDATHQSWHNNNDARMMSPRRWILLLIFYISYLMFGASIYYHIEHALEKEQRAVDLKERVEIHEYLVEQLDCKGNNNIHNNTNTNDVLERISNYCGKPVTDYTRDEYEIPYKWTFYHSFFFAFTVCSTVGYGNISPTTTLGRMIMIAYSVIGIPINGILFAGLGEYFGRTFQAIYRRYKKFKKTHDVQYVPPQLGLITIVAIALVPGITLFLLLPSWVFSYFENWSYSLSFYYAYVTTTTIGFGDYVPTFQPNQPRDFGGWFVVYQLFIIVWFIFALGYLVMIMTFITRGLQSKKLARLEKQLSTNIKATQNRIWNGVTKDVGYLRRILNELYILRVKPVYMDPDISTILHHWSSCPELTMYRGEPEPEYERKRAFSACYDPMELRPDGLSPIIVHASSDTEIDKIDKQKSFENAEVFRHTTELLSKVVTALASVKPPPQDEDVTEEDTMYGGYHGFSDSQILASEWSLPSINEAPSKPRCRASSDFNIKPKWQTRRPTVLQNEWTWSGDNNQIQEAINNRIKQYNRETLYRSSFGQPPVPSTGYVVNVPAEENDAGKKPPSKKFSIPDGLRKLFLFKKRPSHDFFSGTVPPSDRKFSIMSVPDTVHRRSPTLDYYQNTVTTSDSPAFFQRNGILDVTQHNFPSTTSLTSRLSSGSATAYGTIGGCVDATTNATGAYQRNVAGASKKRRESIFTQKPPLGTRRMSMFSPTSAAALSQRRGSLFSTDRSNGPTPNTGMPPRRGSLFPTPTRLRQAVDGRRSSLFSVASEEDLDVLENTTIADLIRALELVHTQAALDEVASNAASSSGNDFSGLFKSDKGKRKVTGASLDLPQAPPLLSLFAGDNTKALKTAATNRLYTRRSTIMGTPLSVNLNLPTTVAMPPNVLTKRRQSATQLAESPPGYEHNERASAPATAAASTTPSDTKFRRRFSVRPTALQIPPGKAPPAGVNINSTSQQATPWAPAHVNITGGPTALAGAMSSSHTALQRRLSLRPSPLARELSIPTTTTAVAAAAASAASTPSSSSSTSDPAISNSISSSSTRLLPFPIGLASRPPNTTSSTHSPLSRIVQISQAQRKSSMPDGFGLDRTK